jgi:hypothetical protein
VRDLLVVALALALENVPLFVVRRLAAAPLEHCFLDNGHLARVGTQSRERKLLRVARQQQRI